MHRPSTNIDLLMLARAPIALILLSLMLGLALSGCTVIHQGEVGVKRRAGRIDPVPLQPGFVTYDPVLTRILKVPIRTVNLEVQLPLPSKDGLNVGAEVSILYRIVAKKAPDILGTIGEDYERVVVMSVFRSAAADVAARFPAKDMYTDARSDIENAMRELMAQQLQPRGFVIEAVLLKSITLPYGLARAIENKLEADQQAQRMEFTLQQERREAERKRIEAEGIREAQRILAEELTPLLLEWETIKAFRSLAKSPNSKLIVTDGKTPLLLENGR